MGLPIVKCVKIYLKPLIKFTLLIYMEILRKKKPHLMVIKMKMFLILCRV